MKSRKHRDFSPSVNGVDFDSIRRGGRERLHYRPEMVNSLKRSGLPGIQGSVTEGEQDFFRNRKFSLGSGIVPPKEAIISVRKGIVSVRQARKGEAAVRPIAEGRVAGMFQAHR
ncbi:MAG: hypothetical protein M2R45_01279 [Verrucomicrobia subdivision 3 bacterium]|nr:hypothetical protein [Limisphaerales bacterium]MCS1415145.1 hypothetical protein [Limisphaerales bacterium]